MTGGLAFIFDDEAWLDGNSQSNGPRIALPEFINKETVTLVKLGPGYSAAKAYIVETLKQHLLETGSKRAKRILENIDGALARATMIVPASEKTNALVQTDATTSASSKVPSTV